MEKIIQDLGGGWFLTESGKIVTDHEWGEDDQTVADRTREIFEKCLRELVIDPELPPPGTGARKVFQNDEVKVVVSISREEGEEQDCLTMGIWGRGGLDPVEGCRVWFLGEENQLFFGLTNEAGLLECGPVPNQDFRIKLHWLHRSEE